MTTDIERLAEMIEKSRKIVFLGGAGVSTESGLPDFRSDAAIESAISAYGCPPEEILSARFFHQHTDVFYSYYRKYLLAEAAPNFAHTALARLEKQGKLLAIVTQNVDTLHRQAGSRRVLSLHGSVDWNRCMECNRLFDDVYMRRTVGVPHCPDCGGLIKPEVTLYDEYLDDYVLRSARARMFAADMLLLCGTSMQVQPAASLPEFFMGKYFAIVNLSPTPWDDDANLVIRAPVGPVLDAAIPGGQRHG